MLQADRVALAAVILKQNASDWMQPKLHSLLTSIYREHDHGVSKLQDYCGWQRPVDTDHCADLIFASKSTSSQDRKQAIRFVLQDLRHLLDKRGKCLKQPKLHGGSSQPK